MKKISFLIFIFLFTIGFSSAIQLSPVKNTVYITQYETKCANIWVLPDDNFEISTYWSLEGKGDLTKYTMRAEEISLGISSEYISDGKYEFCFTPNKGGNWSGIIYFYSSESLVEASSWIDLNVKEINPIQKISFLTGNAIAEIRENNYDLWFMFISLLAILLLVLFRRFN
jgi:hypothetical protein